MPWQGRRPSLRRRVPSFEEKKETNSQDISQDTKISGQQIAISKVVTNNPPLRTSSNGAAANSASSPNSQQDRIDHQESIQPSSRESFTKTNIEEYDVFKIPDASVDDFGFEDENFSQKEVKRFNNQENDKVFSEPDWKDDVDELIFEDIDDLAPSYDGKKNYELMDQLMNKKVIEDEIVIVKEVTFPEDTPKENSGDAKKKISIKDRLFNINNAPGLNFLICLKDKDQPTKIDCLLCKKPFQNKEIEQHLKGRFHLLKILEIEKPDLHLKYKNDSSISPDELLTIVMKVEENLPKQILSTVTKGTYSAVKQSRLSKISKLSQKLDALKTPPKVVQCADKTSSKVGFSNFKRIIIFASQSYAEQLKTFACSSLVEIHSFKSLTFQMAKEQIEKLSKLRPPSVLYLLFLGVHSFANDVISRKCLEVKCESKMRQLFLKDEFLDHMNNRTKADTIVRMTKSLMKSLNSSIGHDSKLLIMPPIPVELLTLSNWTHEQLHDKLQEHPHAFLINASHCTALEEFYQHLCVGTSNAVLSLGDCDAAAHPYTKYAQLVKIPTQVLFEVKDSCLCRDWKQAITDIICMVLNESLATKYLKSFDEIVPNDPKLTLNPKMAENSNSSSPKKGLLLGNKTFDHLVFIGNLRVINKVCSYGDNLPNFSFIETDFPPNLNSMMESLSKLKQVHKQILYFVLADVTLIGKKLKYAPCSIKMCSPSITIQSSSNTSSTQIENDIGAIVEMRERILAEDDQCEVLLLPLFPTYGIHCKHDSQEEEFHIFMHSVYPAYTYLFEGSAGLWFTAVTTLKKLWTEQSKVSFKRLHGEVTALKSLIEVEFPLLRWQEAKLPNLKSASETEKRWKTSFLNYLQSPPPKEISTFFVNKSTLSHYESSMKAKNKALLDSLSQISGCAPSSSKQPFKRIYLIGEPFFLSLFTHPAVSKISYSLQNPEVCNADTIIAQMKSFESGHSACFLFFNTTAITKREQCKKRVCFVNGCWSQSVMSTIPSLTYARNKFYQIKNLVTKLSKHLPTFVLPLYPSLVSSPIPRTGIHHSCAHMLGRVDLCLCTQADDNWLESFNNFGQLWIQFLEWNHKDYPSSAIAKKYIEEHRLIQLITHKVSDFHVSWSERDIWKTFVNAFLKTAGTLDLNAEPPICTSNFVDSAAACKLNAKKDTVPSSPVQEAEQPQLNEEATVKKLPQIPTSGPRTTELPSVLVSKQPFQDIYKNIVEVENVSNLLPSDLFKALAIEVDGTSSVEAKEGQILIKLKHYESALIISRELDNLRVADCILKATIVASEGDPSQPSYFPKKQRAFPKIYSKFHPAIILNIQNEISKARDPATFKMSKCPKQCSYIATCMYYHSNEDRRRNPFVFGYKARLCESGVQFTTACPLGGLKCCSSHNVYEQMLHPSAYQIVACPNLHKLGNCSIKPFCKFAHQNTPEMLFHKLWKDKVVYGLKNSISYLVGSVRGRCKRPDLRNHKNLFISPDPEVVHLADASIKLLTSQHRLKKVAVTDTSGELNMDFSDSQLVLGTLSAVYKNKALMSRGNRFCVLIIDDIATIMNTPSSKNSLIKIIYNLKINDPNFSMINKVFIADEKDDRGIKNQILNSLDISLIEVEEQPKRPDESQNMWPDAPPKQFPSTPSKSSTGNDIQQPRRSPSPYKEPPGYFNPNKRPRSRSRSRSPSKVPRKDTDTKYPKEDISQEEKLILEKLNEEFHVYEDVPEMHPDYEDHYETFIRKYQLDFPTTDDERHKEHYWKEYWKVAFVSLKSQEFTNRLMEFRNTNVSEDRTSLLTPAKEGEDSNEFTVKGTLDLLEDLKGKLGVCEPPLMKLIEDCRSKGTDTPSALAVFASPDTQMLMETIIVKLKGNIDSASFMLKPIFKTACEWTANLMSMSKKSIKPSLLQNLPLDLEAIAKVTRGKEASFLGDFIRSTLALHGMDNCSEKEVNDIIEHVDYLQSKIA